jgi:hypothetical protein
MQPDDIALLITVVTDSSSPIKMAVLLPPDALTHDDRQYLNSLIIKEKIIRLIPQLRGAAIVVEHLFRVIDVTPPVNNSMEDMLKRLTTKQATNSERAAIISGWAAAARGEAPTPFYPYDNPEHYQTEWLMGHSWYCAGLKIPHDW